MTATVTIAKTYFEALLRRAEFHIPHNGEEHAAGTSPACVTILDSEHERLLRDSKEYNILRNALLRGGISHETLNILVSANPDDHNRDGVTLDENNPEPQYAKADMTPKSYATPFTSSASSALFTDRTNVRSGNGGMGHLHPPHPRQTSYGTPSSLESTEKDEYTTIFSQIPRPSMQGNEQRTILLANLSERTTHKDVTNIIRGGRLLDIYFRQDRCVTVSFVEGAQEFFAYAKRNDLYLHTKRVEVRWHERQFHIPGHVANKIAQGVTRNIVIRGADGKLTEKGIRDDLDHIHNLVVIDVKFQGGDAFISTNSIHNALFARTCMMSRGTYKGLRIEWYPDECAAPLMKPPTFKGRDMRGVLPAKATTSSSLSNRFGVLNIDGTENGSDDDDDEQPSGPGFSEYGVDLSWVDEGIVAS